MDEYNYSKLLGRMKELGITQQALAESIRIHASTLNLKLNNKRDFTQGEMREICEILHIDDVKAYFFTR